MSALPAQALDAEQAVLAVMLQAPREIGAARYLLRAADFYQSRHSVLFLAMCELHDAGVTVDPTVLYTHLNKPISDGRKLTHLDQVGGALYLSQLSTMPCFPTNLEYYAESVRNARRIRGIQTVAKRLDQISECSDVETALDLAAAESIDLQLLVDEPQAAEVKGYYRVDDFLSIADDAASWVIPDLLESQDALMWLGGEGAGKSFLLRQFALCVMAGVHPFRPTQRIPARRALLLDVENSEGNLRRSIRGMSHQVARLGSWDGGNLSVLARPGGMNLRKREDRLVIEKILSEYRPAMVAAGPMYKLAPRGRDDWDTAAAEAREVLDSWRERYGCAFVLEHHMPKGDGKDRPLTPFGGSEWMRWVTHGRILRQIPQSTIWELVEFRGDREVRLAMPVALQRGGALPWSAVYDPAEVEYAKGLDIDTGKPRK